MNQRPLIILDGRAIRNPDDGTSRYARFLFEGAYNVLGPECRWILLKNSNMHRIFPHTRIHEIPIKIPFLSLKSIICLSLVINRLRPSLFHAPYPIVPLFSKCCMLSTVQDLMWVVSPKLQMEGSPFRRVLIQFFHAILFTTSMIKSDRLVCNSRATKDAVGNFIKGLEKKCQVIYPGIEDKFFMAQRHNGTYEGLPYLMFVGNTKPYKNIRNILSGFEYALANKFISTPLPNLLITGRKDRMNGRIAEQIKISPVLKAHVCFLGNIDDDKLLYLLSGAKAILFASIQEGFGLPSVEAMAMKVPVIASSIAVLKEITQGAALYPDPREPHSIAEAIKVVMTDPKVCEKMVEQGKIVAQQFNWKSGADIIENIYRDMLGIGTPP
jgi:glycosyltransferase involved in cell wall biosynthesis